MKTAVPSTAKDAQSPASSSHRPLPSPRSGRLAQLAAMMNQSPRVQTQLRLADEIQNSERVQNQMALAADINQALVAQPRPEEKEKTAQREEAPAPNHTGLPDQLKAGVENLSGMSLDDVSVHYNSSKPAQLNALAYAQGTDIHVAPGQEQHLPHEAWHIVQQKQGRVKPTVQMKAGIPVNDDPGLEKEADAMGARALQRREDQSASNSLSGHAEGCACAACSGVLNAAVQKKAEGGMAVIQRFCQFCKDRNDKNSQEGTDYKNHEIENCPEGGSQGPQKKYAVKPKELQKLAKNLNVTVDDLQQVAAWVKEGDKAMWNAFTASKEAVEFLDKFSVTCTADQLSDFKTSEQSKDYLDAAKEYIKFQKAKVKAAAELAGADKESKVASPNTLVAVEKYWKKLGKEVASSKAGEGMCLLKGVLVHTKFGLVAAHIALPPDGNGTFSEGHLKIEGGPHLNQYFFSVDATGKVTPTANSSTVPTENPGKWSDLPKEAWTSVKGIVELLATGKL